MIMACPSVSALLNATTSSNPPPLDDKIHENHEDHYLTKSSNFHKLIATSSDGKLSLFGWTGAGRTVRESDSTVPRHEDASQNSDCLEVMDSSGGEEFLIDGRTELG